MTRQEKIDWGIRWFLRDAFNCDEDQYLYTVSKRLRHYLDSQGVVMKVERELPFVTSSYIPSAHGVYVRINKEVLSEQGYVAVEPLINKKKGGE